MQYPNQYKNFFQDVVTNSLANFGSTLQITSFYYGESRRIEEAMKSDISYPVLWAENPDFQYTERGDNMLKNTIGSFVILAGQPVEEYDGQDDAIDKAVRIAEKVIKEMRTAGYIHIGDKISIEPIETNFSDNCYGARCSFTIRNQEADFLC
jgi:hypothetical protein